MDEEQPPAGRGRRLSNSGREPAAARREQQLLALLGAALVLALAGIVYVALFDLSSTAEWVVLACLLVGGLGVLIAVHVQATPTGQLPHPEKVRREGRHVALLTGALIGLLTILVGVAAFDLNSWSEWVVLAAFELGAAGVFIALARGP
jgi:membrane protein YdbS with pleckstrin-like domain